LFYDYFIAYSDCTGLLVFFLELVEFLTFLNVALTFGGLLVTFLYRKRILRAFARLLMRGVWEFAFVETEAEENGVAVHRLALTKNAAAVSSAVAPVLLQTALKSIKMKQGVNLPINPATGQLDFMAPVLMKVAAGKKVGVEDFLPLIMEKAMPFVEQLLGGLGKGASHPRTGSSPSGESTENPFLKDLTP